MNLQPRDPSHLYPIADQSNEWICGTDPRGLQAFLYVDLADITGIFFDNDGRFREIRKWKLTPYTPSRGREGKELSELAALDASKREIGLTRGTIRIRRLAVERLVVKDWPDSFLNFACAPDDVECQEEERRRLWNEIERWQREGCYVLCFGKDYWIEGDGTIGST